MTNYYTTKIWITLWNHNVSPTDVHYFSYIGNNIKILFSSGKTIEIPVTEKYYNKFHDMFFDDDRKEEN